MEDDDEDVYDIDFSPNGLKMVACGEKGYYTQFTLFPRSRNYKRNDLRSSSSTDLISCRYDKDGNFGLSADSSNIGRWAYINGANGNVIRVNN